MGWGGGGKKKGKKRGGENGGGGGGGGGGGKRVGREEGKGVGVEWKGKGGYVKGG